MAAARLLLTADAVGGVWTYALDLAAGLADLGTETVLAVLGPAPDDRQRAAAAMIPGLRLIETGLPLDWLAADATEVRSAGAAIARLAERERVDLIHLNQPALAAAAMPRPVIAAMHSCVATWWRSVHHGPLPESFRWQADLVREGLARADAILCPSAAFADQVRNAYGLAVAPHVVRNGRRPPPVGATAPVDAAFTAGRLWDDGKDAATLDRAAARLSIPFEAAGAVRSPAGEAIALEHLTWLGSLDEAALAAHLAGRPVFVSAARYEPFGLAVLEAAQAGCALVLSDIPTFHELWGDAAILVAPGDDKGFADAIAALVAEPALRQAHGEAARRRAGRYTATAMAAATAALHRAVLGTRAAA